MVLIEKLAAAHIEIKGLRVQPAMRDAGAPPSTSARHGFGDALDRLEADPKPAKFTGAMLRCAHREGGGGPAPLGPACGAGVVDVAPDYEIGPRDCLRWTCTAGHSQAHGWLFESHAVEGGGTAP